MAGKTEEVTIYLEGPKENRKSSISTPYSTVKAVVKFAVIDAKKLTSLPTT